jgi:hypothetical protein
MRDIVDLDRYPLDRPDAPTYADLVARCRADLTERGAAVLEGFAPEAALERARAELAPVLGHAFYAPKTHNPYLVADDPAFAPDHPRNAPQATDSATLAYDHIGADTVLERLYRWGRFAPFVADVLGFEALHAYADALSPVNVLVYRPGTQTGWHFDAASFVVTLILQQAEGGGVFEYAPFVRTDSDPGFDAVAPLIAGKAAAPGVLAQPAGALVIFTGHYTLHRVTPVTGDRDRLVGVFSLAPEAGRRTDAHNQKTFYGRVA